MRVQVHVFKLLLIVRSIAYKQYSFGCCKYFNAHISKGMQPPLSESSGGSNDACLCIGDLFCLHEPDSHWQIKVCKLYCILDPFTDH